MNKEQILGILRHVLSGLGVYLVSSGLLTEGAVAEIIGAVLTIVGVAWSAFTPEKRRIVKKTTGPIGHLPMILAAMLIAPFLGGCANTPNLQSAIPQDMAIEHVVGETTMPWGSVRVEMKGLERYSTVYPYPHDELLAEMPFADRLALLGAWYRDKEFRQALERLSEQSSAGEAP